VSRAMRATRATDIHVFNPVRGIANGMRINPAINLGGVLGPGTTQKQSRAGDERRIDANAAGSIFAINIEAEVAGFLMGAPFKDDGAIGLGEGLKGGDVHGSGVLNGRASRGSRVWTGVGGRRCNAYGIAGGHGGTVANYGGRAGRASGDVDGDNDVAADGDSTEGAGESRRYKGADTAAA